VLLGLWCVLSPALIQGALRNDFLCWYIGGKLALTGQFAHMYDPAVQWEVQRHVVPDEPILSVFPRPPYFAVLVAPLALLPLRPAFCVWLGIQMALLVICFGWAARRFGEDGLIWGALFGPVFAGIACGQDTSVMLAIFLAGYILAERGDDTWAGAIWALGLIKFNLLLPLPLAMLATRRWRMLQGFALTAASLAIFSVCVLKGEGLRLYFRLLSSHDLAKLNPAPERMMNLQAIGAHLGWSGPVFYIPATLAALALGWIAIRNAPLWRWISSVLIVCLLVTPHVFAYNMAVLLLPAWLGIFNSTFKWTRIAAAVTATPLTFLLRLAGDHWFLITPLVVIGLLVALAAESLSRQKATAREPQKPSQTYAQKSARLVNPMRS
jgi:hypothetical protein